MKYRDEAKMKRWQVYARRDQDLKGQEEGGRGKGQE